VQFSIFFFSGDESALGDDKYRLLLESARFGDQHGFDAIWVPERHFNKFGGLYPNPAVVLAALAVQTTHVRLRAGSVVLPLHHPARVVEDWAMVDNLSRGRVEISFAPGFHRNDFVLAPENFAERKNVMFGEIDRVRKLWRGGSLRGRDGNGDEVEVKLFPKPLQPELPVWITSSGNPTTFVKAGEIGANVLTALLDISVDQLVEYVDLYHQSRARHGHDRGHVTVMLHTYIGKDIDTVKATVRGPFCDYLRSHSELAAPLLKGLGIKIDKFSEADRKALFGFAFDRYFNGASLMGTPESCLKMIEKLASAGVSEVACLIDFGVEVPAVLESLNHLNRLKDLSTQF
jgi:natural product biosynthesis luciferase-like monooxygenase protein